MKLIFGPWEWNSPIRFIKQNKLTLLGTKGGPAVRSSHALPTSSLLVMDGKSIVVDCGIGVTQSIVKSGTALLDIDAIFITHLHSDHVLELGGLLHTIWTSGLRRPIEVYGPKGIEAYIDGFLKSMSFDNAIRIEDEGRTPLEDLILLRVYGEGRVTILKNIMVDALKVRHPPVDECYALSFDNEQTRIVFSADTAFFEPLAAFAKGADMLVHEAMLLQGVENLLQRTPNATRLREHLMASHSTVEEACEIATMAYAKHLILNHLIPADDPDITSDDFLREAQKHFKEKITIGHDGLDIEF